MTSQGLAELMHPFWISTAVSVTALALALGIASGSDVRIVALMKIVNRSLVVLLPAVVIQHSLILLHLDRSFVACRWLTAAEPVVFPVYVTLILGHIVANGRYFRSEE